MPSKSRLHAWGTYRCAGRHGKQDCRDVRFFRCKHIVKRRKQPAGSPACNPPRRIIHDVRRFSRFERIFDFCRSVGKGQKRKIHFNRRMSFFKCSDKAFFKIAFNSRLGCKTREFPKIDFSQTGGRLYVQTAGKKRGGNKRDGAGTQPVNVFVHKNSHKKSRRTADKFNSVKID